jgi:Asp-tRNA(Asn)/Glu-tRNA(Gln) amidotransferase A subunit family amidase
MSETKKVLFVYSDKRPVKAGVIVDLERLRDALRARGAEVEEVALDSEPTALLDRLEGGAVSVVFRGDGNG